MMRRLPVVQKGRVAIVQTHARNLTSSIAGQMAVALSWMVDHQAVTNSGDKFVALVHSVWITCLHKGFSGISFGRKLSAFICSRGAATSTDRASGCVNSPTRRRTTTPCVGDAACTVHESRIDVIRPVTACRWLAIAKLIIFRVTSSNREARSKHVNRSDEQGFHLGLHRQKSHHLRGRIAPTLNRLRSTVSNSQLSATSQEALSRSLQYGKPSRISHRGPSQLSTSEQPPPPMPSSRPVHVVHAKKGANDWYDGDEGHG